MTTFTIRDGVIHSPEGIPRAPRHLADNRLSCALDERGLGDIEYYNPSTDGNHLVFRKGFWGGLRLYIEREREHYPLQLRDCRLTPYGCEGRWLVADGTAYAFTLLLANESIVLAVRSPEPGSRFVLEFYDEYAFRPQAWNGNPRLKGAAREWQEWKLEAGVLTSGYTEPVGRTGIAIGASAGLSFRQSARNKKYMLSTDPLEPGQRTAVVLAFGSGPEESAARLTGTLAELDELERRQRERYAAVAVRAPRLHSGRPELDAFFQLAPVYHESLKLREYPGAVRAKTTNYWVWGWDSLTAADAAAYWGDTALLEQMLDFFRSYTDSEGGIPHAYGRDMSVLDTSPPPAQGMYITLMHVCRNHGLDVSRFYEMAKRIFELILRHEVRDTGLILGTSLYPDYRALIGETGRDLSAFNNTVCYCAVRSMAVLAGAMGDSETAARADSLAERMRRRFEELFFDDSQGFLVCSIDADTLERRQVYSANAVKWENSFCDELTEATALRQLAFFEEQLVSPAGIRPLPVWDRAYDEDANQLSAWWPVMGEYYARLLNRFDRPASADRFIGWIEHWTRKLSIPEGIPCYAYTEDPEQDNWTTLPGTWQAYSMRGWYQAVVHNFIGLEVHAGNLLVFPWSGFELTLENFHAGAAVLNVRVKGQGPHIERILAGGHTLTGTQVIPAELLADAGEVTIVRGAQPGAPVTLQSAGGFEVRGFSCDGARIAFEVKGASRERIKLRHMPGTELIVKLDGEALETQATGEDVTAAWLHAGDLRWHSISAEVR